MLCLPKPWRRQYFDLYFDLYLYLPYLSIYRIFTAGMGKTYFASDFHLGVDAIETSIDREKRIVQWLDMVSKDADAIYLLGDLFDYWFEYGQVVPKGFVRLLGKLAELRDKEIPVYAFTGNHDMWMFGYFESELDIPVYKAPVRKVIKGKQFLIGHGDGLGPGDHGYKFIKKVFASPVLQWLFARIHPNSGIRMMKFFSGQSRDMTSVPEFRGPEREWLIQYCNDVLKTEEFDYFIFGHRHIPIDHVLDNARSRYINLGDWISHYTYAVFDGENVELRQFWNP